MAFSFGAKPNPKIKIPPPKFHTERKAAPAPPQPLPSHLKSSSRSSRPSPELPRRSSSQSNLKSHSAPRPSTLAPPLKRKASRQASPAKLAIQFDSDSEDDFGSPASGAEFAIDKRVRRSSLLEADGDERKAFRAFREGTFKMIHAADIKYPVRKSKIITSVSADGKPGQNVVVEVQYPGSVQMER